MTDQTPTYCIDCGDPTSGGLRCKRDHGRFLALKALTDTAAADAELLREVRDEGLNGQRLGNRIGVTRVRGWQKIKKARTRQAKREALGI